MNKDWIVHAVCRRYDPEWWFPNDASQQTLQNTEQAKTLCRSCPVRERCLNLALSIPNTTGIWGGLNKAQRDELKQWKRRHAYPEYEDVKR